MNRCDKYREWITDAALGSLAAGRESELLAHAAECDACREAYAAARDVRTLANAIDRGVASLISGAPSPHFHARLRARIAAEAPASRFSWRAWAPIAVTATALAFVLAVFVLRTQHTFPAAPATAASPEVAVNSPAPPTSTDPPPAANPGKRGRSPAANHHATNAHYSARLHHASPSEPEVLVEPGQLDAAMQFVDALRSGRIDGPKLIAAGRQVDAPIDIKDLKITPLPSPEPVLPSDPAVRSRP